MCCNYCFHFAECKKAKKDNPDCCTNCAEYEFCPFVLNETANKDLDSPLGDGEDNIDILENDNF